MLTTAVSVGLGYLVARAALDGAKWLARRTRTKRDDVAVARLDRWLTEHPEAIPMIQELINVRK